MSQMDLSQQAHESFSDDDDGNDAINGKSDGGGGGVDIFALAAAAVDDAAEDEFVDAMESLEHAPAPAHRHNGEASTSSAAHHDERNYGALERCGRWLMAIPRDDVVALQQTSEYREFLSAFDELGEAHRRTVRLERQHLLMESEDGDTTVEHSASTTRANFTTSDHTLPPPSPPPNRTRMSSSITTTMRPAPLSHPLSPSSPLRRRRYSFLQHLAVDDVLLRVFEFIDCSSLVRTGTTCHRFRELTTRSAEQRTQRLAAGRLLRSAMRVLRAQEQIEGVGPREGSGPFVPIPMLGLPRRVRVAGAGDPEYDGIYFCTGSNGNGFLFTKPCSPEGRARVVLPNVDNDVDNDGMPTFNMQQLVEMHGAGGIEEDHHPMGEGGGAGGDANNNPFVLAVNGAIGMDAGVAAADEDDGDNSDDVFFGDEPNRSRVLRCVISKRFSNETILWYMSKEVEDETSREISQNYSFWAKLLVTGDATPDVCQYPSQSSILSRNGEPAWQPLTDTAEVAPPVVELLDG